MKANQTKAPIVEMPRRFCVVCGKPTLGWGHVKKGYVCSKSCSITYNEGERHETGNQHHMPTV